MKTRLATSLIALSTAVATPVLADVTAADVWANQQAFFGAMGVTLSGALSGGDLVAPQMNMVLPFGAASFQVSTDATVSLSENSDGTVTITYPSPMAITIKGGAPNEGAFEADMVMTHDDYTIIASGDAGDIAYQSTSTNLRFQSDDLTLEGSEEEITIDGFMTLDSWTGTSQVTEGDVITYSAQSDTGMTVVEFTFGIDNVLSTSKQTAQPTQTLVALSLPAGGSDLMNLSAAMRSGLTALFENTSQGTSSESVVMLDGETMNRQVTSTGAQTAAIAMTKDGLTLTAEASDFTLLMNDPLILPADLEFAIAGVTAAYDLPLNAAEDAQDFRLATSLTGVTMGDVIWGLFDPTAQLPRDAADVSFDVTGTGTNGMDLLDFAAWMQMSGTPPIEIDAVTIENLRIAAVGAEATAVGAMTFDWTDFETFPGFARPEGQVTVNLSGANALMDRLTAMGLFAEADLMMPRMMLGMFATPVGDDQVESLIEVNSEGHLLANGQRLQ